MKRNKREEKGITLVALVVTLVILLILAGITIATLFGDNGVIKKAQKAKDETEQEEKDETAYINKVEKDIKKATSDGTKVGVIVNNPSTIDGEKPSASIHIYQKALKQ